MCRVNELANRTVRNRASSVTIATIGCESQSRLCTDRQRSTIRNPGDRNSTQSPGGYDRSVRAMGFQLHWREIGRVVVIEAVGRLTLTDGHSQLRDLIHVVTGYGAKKLVVNLARVEFIDSYGIGELARSYSVVRQAGGEMKLADVNQKVLDVLTISRLNTIFEIYAREAAALEAFG